MKVNLKKTHQTRKNSRLALKVVRGYFFAMYHSCCSVEVERVNDGC
jgi:hypothetical protein